METAWIALFPGLEYVDRLLALDEDRLLNDQTNLLLTDLRVTFRQPMNDDEFTRLRQLRVGQILKYRHQTLQIPLNRLKEELHNHLLDSQSTDEVAKYIAELYNTVPLATDELKAMFEKYQTDETFVQLVFGMLEETPVSYAQRHETATAELIRFPEFEALHDEFLRRLDETINAIKTRKIYEIDTTKKGYESQKDDLIARCDAVEELFHSHEWAYRRGENLYHLYRCDLANDADWPRFRRCVAEMWLMYLRTMSQSLDTRYEPKPVYLNMSVEGMMAPSGVVPEAIQDQEVRTRYEAALLENIQNRNESQIQTFTIRREIHYAFKNGMTILQDMYRAEADAKNELAELLAKYEFPFDLILDRVEITINRDVTPLPKCEVETPSLDRQMKLLVMMLEFDRFAHAYGTETEKAACHARFERGKAIWKTIVAKIDAPRQPAEEFVWPADYTGSKDIWQIEDKELQQRYSEYLARTQPLQHWYFELDNLRSSMSEHVSPNIRFPKEETKDDANKMPVEYPSKEIAPIVVVPSEDQ